MMQVRFTWWPSVSSSLLGAALVVPGAAVGHVGVGMEVAIPTAVAGVRIGVSERADIGARWRTWGGLSHNMQLDFRAKLSARMTGRISVDEAFHGLEDISNVRAISVPFGARVALSATVGHDPDGPLACELGPTLRLVDFAVDGFRAQRTADLGLESIRATVGGVWDTKGGTRELHVTATVPVQQQTSVVGFWPRVEMRWTWGAP